LDSDISEEELRMLMREVDQNQNGIIETEEFLQVNKKIFIGVVFLIYFLFL
jgi:Ca2+-binding EF-hand superfamily protein